MKLTEYVNIWILLFNNILAEALFSIHKLFKENSPKHLVGITAKAIKMKSLFKLTFCWHCRLKWDELILTGLQAYSSHMCFYKRSKLQGFGIRMSRREYGPAHLLKCWGNYKTQQKLCTLWKVIFMCYWYPWTLKIASLPFTLSELVTHNELIYLWPHKSHPGHS